MTQSFPATVQDFMTLSWDEIAPLFGELNEHPLNAETVDAWLADWSRLNELIDEAYARLYIDTTLNTTDQDAEARFHAFISDIYPNTEAPTRSSSGACSTAAWSRKASRSRCATCVPRPSYSAPRTCRC